jgi:type IV secretory pathway VirB4 component
MLSVVAESCATKMFLANPGMDPDTYRKIFHLNDTETSLIARLIPKKQILLKRPDLAKVLNLNVDPKSYWLYTTNPNDNHQKREAFARHGLAEGLEVLARRNLS